MTLGRLSSAEGPRDLEVRDSGEAPRTLSPPSKHSRTLRRTAFLLFSLQLTGFIIFSTVRYSRSSLTHDFGVYSQAWWATANGHLDPWISLIHTQFWRNNAEFLFWPIEFVGHLFAGPVTLLWAQDVAVVATELVTFGWILELLQTSGRPLSPGARASFAWGSLGVLLLNPWAYETIAFDFHFEAAIALFLLLTGRALWRRRRSVAGWALLTLLSGALGGLYLFGLGISGSVADRKRPLAAVLVGATGLVWFVFFSSVGGMGAGGAVATANYGYLVGPHTHVDVLTITSGVFHHPGAVWHLVAARWARALEFLVVAGLIGAIWPWAVGVVAVAFVPTLLSSGGYFLRAAAAFQIWPAIPFVVVGSVQLLVNLHRKGAAARRLEAVVAGVTIANVLALGIRTMVVLPSAWIAVGDRAGAQLAFAEHAAPVNAEVIASSGVVGRFFEHSYVYDFPLEDPPTAGRPTTFPIDSRLVFFVFTPDQGVSEAPVHETKAAIRYVQTRLGAMLVSQSHGVYVFWWNAPVGEHTVSLP